MKLLQITDNHGLKETFVCQKISSFGICREEEFKYSLFLLMANDDARHYPGPLESLEELYSFITDFLLKEARDLLTISLQGF